MSPSLQAWTWIMDMLEPQFGVEESRAMGRWMLEDLTGMSLGRYRTLGSPPLDEVQWAQLRDWIRQLRKGRPFHYVMGYQVFCTHKFRVDESVLIPRRETEELVDWILESEPKEALSLWDLGTGSGCIPISIKKARPQYRVFGADISLSALELARWNARQLGVEMDFRCLDIGDLNEELPPTDLLVSNPPYIPESEKNQLQPEVRDHEPSLALFVPDADPLLFYGWLGTRGLASLHAGGRLYLETHRDGAEGVRDLLIGLGYQAVEIKADASGHPRMIRAIRP